MSRIRSWLLKLLIGKSTVVANATIEGGTLHGGNQHCLIYQSVFKGCRVSVSAEYKIIPNDDPNVSHGDVRNN